MTDKLAVPHPVLVDNTATGLMYYQEMLTKCREIKNGIFREGQWLLLLGYFRLGDTIRQYEREGKIKREYSESTIAVIAQDLGMSASKLYIALQVADYFGTETALEDIKRQSEEEGFTLNITYVKRYMLPDPSEEPEKYGGVETVADQAMSVAESLAKEVEDFTPLLHSDDLSVDKRREIAGVVLKSMETLQDIASPSEYSSMAKVQWPYSAHIASLPCILCDQPGEPYHIVKSGFSNSISDYLVIPLCDKHSDDLSARGVENFEKWHGISVYREIIKCLVWYIQQAGLE